MEYIWILVLIMAAIYLIYRISKNMEEKRESAINRSISDIDRKFSNELKKPQGSRNFGSIIDQYSNIMQRYPKVDQHMNVYIRNIWNTFYESANSIMRSKNSRPYVAFNLMKDLSTITLFRTNALHSLSRSHEFPDENSITPSVFNDIDNINQAILEYKQKMPYYSVVINELIKYLNTAENANEEDEFNILSFADDPSHLLEDFRHLPIAIVLQENHDSKIFDYVLSQYLSYFGQTIFDKNGNITRVPTTDYIIAIAFNYSKGGVIDKINDSLKLWISYYKSENYVCEYDTLIKIFTYLKARKQEEMILDGLFTNNLPRTKQHETRLKFLKNKIEDSPEILTAPDNNNIFAFDYRSSKWKVNDLKSYVENAVMSQQKISLPMVIEEWEHDITVENFLWDINKVLDILQENLITEYNEGLKCEVKSAGSVTDSGIETVPSILISAESGRFQQSYPWLSFLVMGDQLTRNRVNLSIYVLIIPNKVEYDSNNIVEANKSIGNKLIVMKEGQNPNLNRLISSIRYTVTKTIEDIVKSSVSPTDFFY